MFSNIREVNKSCIHPKIVEGLTEMIVGSEEVRFYAEFLSFCNFVKSEQVPTAYATVTNAQPVVGWNEKFIEKSSIPECNFTMIHESLHLLGNHTHRAKCLGRDMTGFNGKLANIAMDMLIDEVCDDIQKKTDKVKMFDWVQRVPAEYKELVKAGSQQEIWEDLYFWLLKEKEKFEDWKKSQPQKQDKGNDKGNPSDDGEPSDGNEESKEGEGKGEGKEKPGNGKNGDSKKEDGEGDGKEDKADGCPVSKQLRKLFENIDEAQFDIHDFLKDVPEEMRDAVMKDIMQNLRNRGLVPNSIEEMLKKINPSKKDYLKEIISGVNYVKGKNKSRTYQKMPRRGVEGFKGCKKFTAEINVVLDVSGSMNGYIEKVLSVIFKNDIVCNLIQCDAKIQKIVQVKSKQDIQKMNIKGLGGTELQPAIDEFKRNKLFNKNNLVVLTDGYCDSINLAGIRKVLLVTCAVKIPVSAAPNHLREVTLPKEKD
jgi:predicted metal-dependent peptidase